MDAIKHTVKVTLSHEWYEKLEQEAADAGRSIQDIIRDRVCEEEKVFIPEEAVRRIKCGAIKGKADGFTLPDVYGTDWTISRGAAGVFGKNFFNYTSQHPEHGIRFKDMGPYGRRAVYTYEEPTE